MVQWVITVAGIAILAVICDIILPDGATRKYIKTVIGVVVTLVMLQPIVGFVDSSIAFDNNKGDYNNVQIQQQYLEMVEEKQVQSQIKNVQNTLNARGIEVQIVDFDKKDKAITIQTNIEYSIETKSLIDKAFNVYFKAYEIKISWN